MAVIWQTEQGGKCYQVRRSGASLRLYTDGIFHSQYNPNQLGGGSLWDLLAMPCQLLSELSHPKALVLGVGGGAAIRYLRDYLHWLSIVGVDLDRVHLDIAKKHFGVDSGEVRLVGAEAQQWIRRQPRAAYDFILDDLFGEQLDTKGLPVRAIKVDLDWLKLLRGLLTSSGILVLNVESTPAAKKLCRIAKDAALFSGALRLGHKRYENEVVILTVAPLATQWRRQLLKDCTKLSASNCRLVKVGLS